MTTTDGHARSDALGTLRSLPAMWRWLTEGIPAAVLRRPHAADGRAVIDEAALTAQLLTTTDAVPVNRVGPVAQVTTSVRSYLSRLDGDDVDDVTLGPLADATSAAFRAAGRHLHAAGHGAATQCGRVVQVNASRGGVPKSPVEVAAVGRRGLDVDRQAERRHHGKPMQALCLWSSDVIAALRREGHGLFPGAAGENLTVAGVDWTSIRPGVRLRVGDVVATVSAYATPCVKNAGWFTDGRFARILHDEHPGWSRVYAWVDAPGEVAAGDEVVVEP